MEEDHNQAPELPPDMLWELLLRQSIKFLLAYRAVSKLWRSIIMNKYFVQEQMRISAPFHARNYHYIEHSDFTTTATKRVRFSLLGIYEGLVVERFDNRISVRNPATRKVIHLPKPPENLRQIVFKFDSSTGIAKLICKYSLRKTGSPSEEKFMVLSIGLDNQWRPLQRDRQNEYLMVCGEQGKIYFLCRVQTTKGTDLVIGDFNLRTELSVDFKCPSVFSNLNSVYPFWWDKKLAFGEVREKDLHVVVLEGESEETEIYNWTETTVSLETLGEHIIGFIPMEAISNELWFYYGGSEKYCYNMRTAKMTKRRDNLNEQVFYYRPSLKTLEERRDAGAE